MSTTIYLIRHAEISFIPNENRRGLSEKGKKDARILTERLRSYNISKVISSPYLRAVDTVKGIAEERGLDIEIIDDFRERKITSGYIKDFYFFTKSQWEDFEYCLHQGESLNEVKMRGITAVRMLLSKYKGENMVISTHGTILAAMINYYDSNCDYNFWLNLKMPDVYKLIFEGKELMSIEHIEI